MKQSNDIVIKRFSDTAFTSEDVHRLVDEAWQRWFDAGLDSVWFHSSEVQFTRTIKRIEENITILGESWFFYIYFRPLSAIFQEKVVTLRQKQEYMQNSRWKNTKLMSVQEHCFCLLGGLIFKAT